jgi:hypothetical protein
MILLILRLRSYRTRSLVSGPNTRCGATTIVLPSLDVGLKTLQPVSAGSFEAIEIQHSFASEHTRGNLIGFERSVEFPSFVRGIEVVRRDENLESMCAFGLEDALHVLNSIGFLKTFADQGPGESFSLKISFCGSSR